MVLKVNNYKAKTEIEQSLLCDECSLQIRLQGNFPEILFRLWVCSLSGLVFN